MFSLLNTCLMSGCVRDIFSRNQKKNLFLRIWVTKFAREAFAKSDISPPPPPTLFFFANCCKLWDGDVETNNLISIFSSLRAGNRCKRRHRFPAAESGSRPRETKVVCCVRGEETRFSLYFFFYRRGKSGSGSIGLF